jgi:hypothetical protein
MVVNWDDVTKAIFPTKNYEELTDRLVKSLSFAFIRETYNFTLPELSAYTQQLLGGDTRSRYDKYADWLVHTLERLAQAGVRDGPDLVAKLEKREQLEWFSNKNGVEAPDIAGLLKYLVYWVIPMEKYLSGLVPKEPVVLEACQALRGAGVRTNLELLEQGRDAAGRKVLVEASGLPEGRILELVRRADFSRLPWASKATISNIIGAGYASLAKLANADLQQLSDDFFRYGEAIGKNLKIANEIESSHRIAQILPVVVT